MRNINLIDITPDDDSLSPEAREAHRAEAQPRGHEALDDSREAELYARKEELLKQLAKIEEAEAEAREREEAAANQKAEKKTGPAALVEAFKHNKAFRAKATGAAAIAIASIGLIAGAYAYNSTKNAAPTVEPAAAPVIVINDIEDTSMDETEVAPDTHEEEETKGIEDGYDKEGMWTDEGKPNTVAFANFEKVVDMHDGDIKESVKYVAGNETEALSDYISGLKDELRPAGFEKLSMTETNDKIENQLSPEEYDEALKSFNETIDRAEVNEITLNGEYSNAYEAVKDGDNLLGSKKAIEKGVDINHESMQLIQCSTNEKGTKAYELSWRDDDGKVIGRIVIKGPCAQVVDKKGSNPARLAGLPSVQEQVIHGGGAIPIPTPTPTPTPTPEPTPTPTPTPPPKWGKHGNPNAGTDYLQTIVTNPAVPDIININDGNQGYIDDGGAAPGEASSEYTGGGEDQSDGNMAGENPYQDDGGGQAVDDSGNQAQEQAQEHNDAGGNNNSDKQEESRVAEGDF